MGWDLADIPISEGSLAPANSPASGIQRAHPYTPVGAAIGNSSFELLPSARDRATSDRGLDESMETVPILRSNSSPSIIQDPSQVMSPNLVAGSAPNTTPLGSGSGYRCGRAGDIAAMARGQDGARAPWNEHITQCAQTWPLASHVKLEGMESSIHTSETSVRLFA